jgi:hypothetical protein
LLLPTKIALQAIAQNKKNNYRFFLLKKQWTRQTIYDNICWSGGNVRFYNEIQIFFSKKCNFRYSGRAGKKRVQEKNEIFFTFTSFEYDRFSAKVETLVILPIEVLPTIGLFLCTYLRESSAFKN